MIRQGATRFTPPIIFGDDDSARRYEAACELLVKEARARRWDYVVAPRLNVNCPNGSVVRAGERIVEGDLAGGALPPRMLLARLVRSGHVLETDYPDWPDSDTAA